jgi:hypothetical protein
VIPLDTRLDVQQIVWSLIMSRDDLERIYLMSHMSGDTRFVLENQAHVKGNKLVISCPHNEIDQLQLEITRVINANPHYFSIQQILFISEIKAIRFSVGKVAS